MNYPLCVDTSPPCRAPSVTSSVRFSFGWEWTAGSLRFHLAATGITGRGPMLRTLPTLRRARVDSHSCKLRPLCKWICVCWQNRHISQETTQHNLCRMWLCGQKDGFKTWFHHFLATWPWASGLTFLSLSLPRYKRDKISVVTSWGCWKD